MCDAGAACIRCDRAHGLWLPGKGLGQGFWADKKLTDKPSAEVLLLHGYSCTCKCTRVYMCTHLRVQELPAVMRVRARAHTAFWVHSESCCRALAWGAPFP